MILFVALKCPAHALRVALARKITQAHADSRGAYSSPRVCKQQRLDGETVNVKPAAKAMKTLE